MVVKRNMGIEIEGFVSNDLVGYETKYWKFVEDGSLDYDCDCCGGSGEYEDECPDCNGSGHVDCRECHGYGEVDCPYCNGSGDFECIVCSGSGLDDDGQVCSYCEGEGSLYCDECGGSARIECPDCNGSGEEYCDYCSGNGYVWRECDYCYGKQDVECTSFVIENDDELDEAIDELYWKVDNWEYNHTCGIHIHVDGSELDANAIRRLATLAAIVEPYLYNTLPPSRRSNRFCNRMNLAFLKEIYSYGGAIVLSDIFNAYYEGKSVEDGLNIREEIARQANLCKYESERYYGLNIHSFFYRGTVEFRYFPSLDIESSEGQKELDNYIRLVQNMVDLAVKYDDSRMMYVVNAILSADEEDAADMLSDLLEFKLNSRAVGYMLEQVKDAFRRITEELAA